MENEIRTQLNLKMTYPFGKRIELTERFDILKLRKIIANPEYVQKHIRKDSWSVESAITNPRLLFVSAPNGIYKESYIYRDELAEYELGRVYSKNIIALQRILREIRHTITSEIYDDIDLVNAHPTILEGICGLFGIQCNALQYFNANRDLILYKTEIENNVTREYAKKLFIDMGEGNIDKYDQIPEKTLFMKNYYEEYLQICINLTHYFPETAKFLHDRYTLRKEYGIDIYRATVKLLLETYENHILMTICDFFHHRGILDKDAILLFDGLLLPKNKRNSVEVILCQKFIRSVFKIPLSLKNKPMDDIIDLSHIPQNNNLL